MEVINNEQLIKDLRCLGWREYQSALSQAIEKKILLCDADLIFAILEIPEHYKISALVTYTNKVKPISEATYKLLLIATEKSANKSYNKHLNEELLEIKYTLQRK